MKREIKGDFKIMVKHPMWKGWKGLVHMYSRTQTEAYEEARKAKCYYEGATATKAVPIKISKSCQH